MIRRHLRLAALGLSILVFAGCQEKLNMLKARRAFKNGHQHYANKDYQLAVDEYKKGLELDPNVDLRVRIPTFFYLGSSHHLMYRPGADDAENDAHLDDAMENYETALSMVETEVPDGHEFGEMLHPYRRYAMEQLAAIHRDNLDDYAGAEEYFRRLVEVDAQTPERYYALADVYERFHDPDEMPLLDKAIEAYQAPIELTPDDPVVYRQVANLLNKYGRFDDTMDWLRKARDVNDQNPEGYYLIAVHYWDKVYRDPDLQNSDKTEYISLGLQELDQALEIDGEYIDALIYKNLLLREQAKLEPGRANELVAQADELRDKAIELRKAADEAEKAAAAAAAEAAATPQ